MPKLTMSLSSIFKEEPYNPLKHNLDLDERLALYQITGKVPNMGSKVNFYYVGTSSIKQQEQVTLSGKIFDALAKISFNYYQKLIFIMILCLVLCFGYAYYEVNFNAPKQITYQDVENIVGTF